MGTKDTTQKILLDYNDVFADAINGLLFGGEKVVKSEELESYPVKSQFKADGTIHEQERDVAKYWTQGGLRLAVIGIENQSHPDADMPLRICAYDGASYKEQLIQRHAARKNKKLPLRPLYPAVTIVLNFGDVWDKPKSLIEAIGEDIIPLELRKLVNDYKITVIDVKSLSEKDLEKFTSDFGVFMEGIRSITMGTTSRLSGKQMCYPDATLKALSVFSGDTKFEETYHNLSTEELEGGVTMMMLSDRLIAQGEARERERARALADEEIVALFQEGLPIEAIARVKKVSVEYVYDILRKSNLDN